MKTLITLIATLFAVPALALDISGQWWQPAEPGWGIAIQQQRDIAFVQLFTYDAGGDPVWYIASCQLQANTCGGTLYSATGGSPLPYYSKPTIVPAGQMTLQFSGDGAATFSYKIGNGVAWATPVVKMAF